ncbi:MAG: DnaJ domain-containing protein [Actinomycetota bacterium]|nr:DnaJ domain-containing protein [Actinomycetota bacterium]MDQ2984430.1 DnaJ domain-containing protein [Actinomycetota bacterium]
MLTTERDYYDVLGVGRHADGETIKKAYRARARELHPDVSADPEADARFSELAEAYSVLSKSSSRLLYDRFGYRGRGNGWFGSVEGIVSEATLFDVWPAARRRQQQKRKPVAEVVVDTFEAARGTTRKVTFATTESCKDCGGSGAARGAVSAMCPACNGTGRSKQRQTLPDARLLRIEDCPQCEGAGTVHSEPCAQCNGAGEASVERTFKVEVPPGTIEGDRLPLEGAGDGAVVAVRVKTTRDSRVARYGALLLLVTALVFLGLLLLR